MKLRTTIKMKVAIGIALTIIVLGAVVSTAAYRLVNNAIIDISKKYINTLIAQQKEAVDLVFGGAMTFTQSLAAEQIVIDYLQAEHRQLQDPLILEHLLDFDLNKRYESINIMDATGVDLVSTNPLAVGQNFKFREYFKQAIVGTPYIEDAISVVTKTFGYYFSAPVKDDTGKIIGIIAVKVRRETLDTAIKPKALSQEGAAMLVDQYGVVIQASKPELLYKSVGPLTATSQKAIAETQKFEGITITPLPYELLGIKLGTTETISESRTYDNLHKQDEIVGIKKIDTGPFFLMIEESMTEFTAMARKIVWLLVAATMLAGGVGALLLWIALSYLLRPLMVIKNAAIKVGTGKLDETVAIKTGDEFEELGIAFNAMVSKLSDVYENLEEKVWERTADFEKFRLAVEAAPDPVIITDIDGRILYANKAMERLTGYGRSEIIGNKPSLWGRQMPDAFYKKLWGTIKDEKKDFLGEITNIRKNGERYISELHISPLLIGNEKLYGFVGVERDVTAVREADRAKTDFVSIASHQLRTPLAVINWYIEMLLKGDVGAVSNEQGKYLEQIQTASRRMVDLVNSLLNVSRIEVGVFDIEPEPLALSNIADAVFSEINTLVKEKALRVIKRYDPELPLINTDPALIRIVLHNLISNAVKYTPRKGTVTVLIDKKGPDTALITVADTGYGIPLHQQSKVFEKFFRGDNVREREPDGNGLGLYIVKSIVKQMQGKIWFISEENNGTTFYVTIPLSGMQKQERSKTPNK